MDFLDPKKQKAHGIRLAIGYAVIGMVLILATTILLYQAYGYGVDRNGRVIQNGLVYMSSQPKGGDIFLNGQRYKDQTNTRVTAPAGQYTVEIRRDGYRTWRRAITIEGGSVERFDYPFLFPSKLTAITTKQYSATPLLATQSIDKRWLLVSGTTPDTFDVFDIDPAKPEVKTLTVPGDILAAGSTTTGWQVVAWAGDDRHVLLKRTYQKNTDVGNEYILFDRQNPDQSQNLSVLLGFTPTTIELRGHNYDQYFAFDQNSGVLFTATLKKPTPQVYLDKVLAFKTDGNAVLYATTQGARDNKVLLRLRQNADPSYTVREVPAGSIYLLALARYSGTLYVAAGAASESKVYVYQDPLSILKDAAKPPLVPVQILKTIAPTRVSFSPNARFVMSESGDRFAVYDAETDKGYAYQAKVVVDNPEAYASWMDGYHLTYISGGHVAVFDFDGANLQVLNASAPQFVPFFMPNYHAYYALNAQNSLIATPLLVQQ